MKNKANKIYKSFSLIAVIAIAVTIFLLSAQNSTESAETSGTVIGFFERFFKSEISQEVIRTVAHCCEYAGFGFFVCNAFLAFKNKLMPLMGIITAFAYAVTDEIHQIFVPGRAFQISDLAVDLSGIVVGTLCFVILCKIIEKRKARANA